MFHGVWFHLCPDPGVTEEDGLGVVEMLVWTQEGLMEELNPCPLHQTPVPPSPLFPVLMNMLTHCKSL